MAQTPSAFLDKHGGARAVAIAIGAKPGTVQVWKHRERIPRDAWPDLLLKLEGVTLPALLAVEQAGRKAKPDAQKRDVAA